MTLLLLLLHLHVEGAELHTVINFAHLQKIAI